MKSNKLLLAMMVILSLISLISCNKSKQYPYTQGDTTELVNGSFDDWYNDGKTWYPNMDLTADHYYWDSGNRGVNTLSAINPTSPEENLVVKGKAVKMASTKVLGTFAAGSLYYGQYKQTILFPNLGAELYMGRPFTSRPTALKGYYHYLPGKVDQANKTYNYMLGQSDSCYVYALLADWDAPFIVNSAEGIFMDFDADYVVAFGELKSNKATDSYTEFVIDLQYKRPEKTPTFLSIVATASKYGDYYTGSTSSILYLDELELVY